MRYRAFFIYQQQESLVVFKRGMMASSHADIQYLTPADIYAIAEAVLSRRPDVRDRHLLRKAAARPMLILFGEEIFPTLADKAAALLHALAAHHLFYDGNKRTATAATIRFLALNGFRPTWNEDVIYTFVLEVAQNRYDLADIAAWLERHIESDDSVSDD